MLRFMLAVLLLADVFLVNLNQVEGEPRHIIIHVPYRVKMIKHKHTIIKHVQHKGHSDKESILGLIVSKPIHSIGRAEESNDDNWGGNTPVKEEWTDGLEGMSFGNELGGASFEGYQ